MVQQNPKLRQQILKKFQQKSQSKAFRDDVEFLDKLSLKDLDQYQELNIATLTQSKKYLIGNFRLEPFYRRFISPRRIIGRLIDKVKNKFYYEIQHFIGAIISRQQELNKHSANAINKLVIQQEELHHQIQSNAQQVRQVQQSINDVAQELSQLTQQLHKSIQTQRITNSQFTEDLNSHQQEVGQLSVQLQQLTHKQQQLQSQTENLQNQLVSEVQNLNYPSLDFDYIGFERQFYGNHQSLQAKHAHYLPYFKDCQNILDIGCGSGAFLSLLQQHGISGQGIDSNPQVIKDCQQHDIQVTQASANEFLQQQPDQHFDGISCFHMIEHLQPQDFLEFLQLCYRKLKPGAHLLLETPNTEMLGVFNKGFFMDLTHIRPVHPQTVKFLLQDLGFNSIQTKTLSQLPDGDRLDLLPENDQNATINQNINKLNQTLFGNQDVAIIAQK